MSTAVFSRLFAAFLFLPLFLHTPATHAEPTWTEVRSPHFRVLTDSSGREGRMVAHEFEQMRYVLCFGSAATRSSPGPR